MADATVPPVEKEPIISPTDPRVTELRELTETLGGVPQLQAKQHRLVRELHADGATPTELAEWIGRSTQRVWQIVTGGKASRRQAKGNDDRNAGSA